VEANTASGFIVTAVEGLAAEHYRRVISEKTRDALARLRASGRRVSGRLPYGFRLAADGRTLEPNPEEQAALAAIRRLACGRTVRALSRELAKRGIMTRTGRPFEAKTLWRLVVDRGVRHSANGSGVVA
jgi:site-specific DNA recombinase